MTPEELERRAYVEGDTKVTAIVTAMEDEFACADAERIDELEDEVKALRDKLEAVLNEHGVQEIVDEFKREEGVKRSALANAYHQILRELMVTLLSDLVKTKGARKDLAGWLQRQVLCLYHPEPETVAELGDKLNRWRDASLKGNT